MRIEGDFKVVNRFGDLVTLAPKDESSVKVLDGSFQVRSDVTLKDEVKLTLNVSNSEFKIDKKVRAFSDDELRETAVHEIWNARGGISGNPRPKDDDPDVKRLVDELKAVRDDESDDDLVTSPSVKLARKKEQERINNEGVSEVKSDEKLGIPGGVTISSDEAKTLTDKGEADKRFINVPSKEGASKVTDSEKSLGGEKRDPLSGVTLP